MFRHSLGRDMCFLYGARHRQLDGDGDVDVLSAFYYDETVDWHENDGSQSFTEHIIDDSAGDAWAIYAIDVDGDGDVDALSGDNLASTFVWSFDIVPFRDRSVF